jgi:hypothetical protein
LKVACISLNCTCEAFSFLTQITLFNYQKIQIKVPYNSTKSKNLKCGKILTIGRLYGCNSLLSLGTQLKVKVVCSHNVLHQCQKKKLRILFSHFFWSFFFSPSFFLFFSIFFTLLSFFLLLPFFFFLFWNKFFEQLTALFSLFCHGSHWCVFGVCGVLGTIVAFLLPLPLFLQVSIIFHVSLILGHFLKKMFM